MTVRNGSRPIARVFRATAAPGCRDELLQRFHSSSACALGSLIALVLVIAAGSHLDANQSISGLTRFVEFSVCPLSQFAIALSANVYARLSR